MALAKIVKKAITPEKQMEDLINNGVAAYNEPEAKRQEEKRRNFFSGSSIGYCLRNTFFKNKNKEKESAPTFLKKVNFGSSLHELYQDYLQCSGSLFGNFYCKYCQKITGPSFSPQSPCDCGGAPVGKLPKYSELSVIHPKLKIAAHPDGFVRIDKKLRLIEIKTVSPYYKIGESINNVKKYVPEHIRQANFYSGLVQDENTILEAGTKDILMSLYAPEYFFLLYSDKGKDDTVAYRFDYSSDQYIADKKRVKAYWEAVKADEPPPAEPGNGGCRYCAWTDRCNALKGY